MRLIESIEGILKRPYTLLYSILIFFTPLVFANNTNELFEFPKINFVYIVGLFIISVFVTGFIIKPVELKLPDPLVAVFFVLTAVSTIFSSHLYTSFYGYYTRFNDGLLSYIVFFGLYFVGINKLSREELFKILRISIFSIVPISFYGLSQHFNGTARIFSTLGQPNWMAQYLAMLLPVLIYYSLVESSKNFKIWFAIFILGYYCLWLSYSVSVVMSFYLGIILMAVKIARSKLHLSGVRLRISLLIIMSISISISNLGMFKDKVSDVFIDLGKHVYLFKVAYADDGNNKISDPGFIRLYLWESSIKLIFSNPKVFFLGTGPETFPYAFQPFRSNELNYSSEWDFVFNKPHNYYLELWSESGFFTAVMFIFIMVSSVRKSSESLAPSFLVFGISNIFGWPTVSTSLLFWLLLMIMGGDLSGLGIRSPKIKIKERFKEIWRFSRWFVVLLLWVSVTCLVFKLYSFYYADIYYKKSQEVVKAGEVKKALILSNKSLDLNPYEPNYYRGRAKILTALLVEKKDIENTKSNIFHDLQRAVSLNPHNLVTIRNSIPIYYFLAIENISQNSIVDNIDDEYIEFVKDFYEENKINYKNDVGVILSVAKYEKKLGLNKEFDDSVSIIRKLRPDILEWHELFR